MSLNMTQTAHRINHNNHQPSNDFPEEQKNSEKAAQNDSEYSDHSKQKSTGEAIPGLQALLDDMVAAVRQRQPPDIYSFLANYTNEKLKNSSTNHTGNQIIAYKRRKYIGGPQLVLRNPQIIIISQVERRTAMTQPSLATLKNGNSYVGADIAAVPSGLEDLLCTTKLIIEEHLHGDMGGKISARQYDIIDQNGDRIFFASETSGLRSFCSKNKYNRAWRMKVYDCKGVQVLEASKSEVKSMPLRHTIGYIQAVRGNNTKWRIFNEINCLAVRVDEQSGNDSHTEGVAIENGHGTDWDHTLLHLMSPQEPVTEIGQIKNTLCGHKRGCCDQVISVSFPDVLEVKIKAVLLYLAFLIDLLFLEDKRLAERKSYYMSTKNPSTERR